MVTVRTQQLELGPHIVLPPNMPAQEVKRVLACLEHGIDPYPRLSAFGTASRNWREQMRSWTAGWFLRSAAELERWAWRVYPLQPRTADQRSQAEVTSKVRQVG
jgi:hypothetical protein